VIRSREHLAALKPNGEALILELMHFADEIVEQAERNATTVTPRRSWRRCVR
jgi:non-homologous end joining protein Ku